MNLEKRFCDVRHFLKEHIFLADWEALSRYPLSHEKYELWMKDIQKLSEDQKFELENTSNPELINNLEYKIFLEQIESLINLPTKKFKTKPIDPILGRKMKGKKRHEIEIILEQLKDLNINHFIDIGSGAGHLSSVLLFENNKTSECIDSNIDFQKIGIDKLTRDFPELRKRMTYTNKLVNDDTEFSPKGESALIGLHSCGDLSVNLIKQFSKSQMSALLNYGCCFHKLSEHLINLSNLAKEDPIQLTNHALTMATKSYKAISKKEYEFRKNVKFFRYGLHILLFDKYQREFSTLGSATTEDYNGDFADYCFKYVPELANDFSKEDLTEFFNSEKTKHKIQYLLDYGIIRSHIARVIELYLILDRAIYLQEQGQNVEVLETFNKDISPRNISLFAQRNS